MVKRTSDGSIDVNGMLVGLNLIIVGLMLFAFAEMGGNEYVNRDTVALGAILAVQTHLALLLERRRRDPFVILLAFTMILFFSLRIVTLTVYPFSLVFLNYPFSAANLNYAILFIAIANTALYGGFYATALGPRTTIRAGKWTATATARPIVLLLAVLLLGYAGSSPWRVPRVFSVLRLLVANNAIVLLAVAYVHLFAKSMSRLSALLIVGLILGETIVNSFLGSRSAVLVLVVNVMMVFLATDGFMAVRRAHILVTSAFLPAVLVLLVLSFSVSTFIRGHEAQGSLSFAQKLELAREASQLQLVKSGADVLLPPVFDRIGYLDYSAEIIANRQRYDTVMSISSYAKSIVDNLLTPGFDVFDQPRISHALSFVRRGSGPPQKHLVEENYQSDQLGLYGEFFVLLGYASIPVLFVLAFLLKRAYVGVKSVDPLTLTMKRVVVLVGFQMMMNSYGLDWTIIEMVPFVASIYIWRFFFVRSLRGAAPAPQAS